MGWVQNENLWAQIQTATPPFSGVSVNLSQRNFSCTKTGNSEYLSPRIKHYCSQWPHLFLLENLRQEDGISLLYGFQLNPRTFTSTSCPTVTPCCCPGLKPFHRLKENTTWRSSQECRLPVPWQGKLVLLSHIQVFHVTHLIEKLNFPCSDTFIAADPQLLQNRANLLKVKRHFWQHAVTPSSANGSVSENSSCVAGNYYCSY